MLVYICLTKMKVLFALSNPPSKEFVHTRHNAGRMFIQKFLIQKIQHQKSEYKNFISYSFPSKPNLLACVSNTYMNLSGKAVDAFLAKNKTLSAKHLIIVHDDLEHKLGSVRIKENGSAQGHNGVISVIGVLKTNEVKRLQIGIDRPKSHEPDIVAAYVLQNFNNKQREQLQRAFEKAYQLLADKESI